MKTLVLSAVSIFGAVAFSQAANAACGNVEVSKGDVKIVSGASKQEAPAAIGSKICAGDTIVAGKDSRAKLKMEDGNELNISPDSKIVLETYQYSAAENKKKVLLNVLSGKVRAATKQENMYNDKARDGADNSFQVRTKSAVAGVRGTDFLTGYDPKTNKSEVVTFRGKVDFGALGANGQITGTVSVGVGQKADMLPGQAPAAPKMLPPKELLQMNSETKGEAPPAPAAPGGVAAGDSKDKKGEAKDAAKDGPKDIAKDGPKDGGKDGAKNERAPAATSPVGGGSVSGGSMLSSADLGGGAGVSPNLPSTSTGASIPQLPVISPVVALPAIPICQQCIDAIQASPTKLRINVTVKN